MDDPGRGDVSQAGAAGGDGLLGAVLEASHEAAPQDLPALVHEAWRGLGLTGAKVFLADLQQRLPVPLPDPQPREPAQALEVDGTLAGRAHRMRRTETTAGPPAVGWIPLVDGIERIGVLRIEADTLVAPLPARACALASLVTLVVVSTSTFSDVLVRTVRPEARPSAGSSARRGTSASPRPRRGQPQPQPQPERVTCMGTGHRLRDLIVAGRATPSFALRPAELAASRGGGRDWRNG
ncbi:hypothetical protein OG871_37430 [Kitasatospora sp. NBC_00374]|uniref:hypothetical protein n=1 Tax=Kitasatospora sp. NBC_00374 TaxID=2975964 RepID=UPI0030DF1487